MANDEILGRGWEFPPAFNISDQGPKMISGEEDVENSIYVILHTKLGERILRNEFGSNIYDLMFEPLTQNMKTYMASTLKQSLVNNEPRITVDNLTLVQDDPALGRVDIHIDYSIINSNNAQNLVLPFYTPENF